MAASAGAARPIAIFGAGGFGREVLQVVLDINAQAGGDAPWRPVGFIVDGASSADAVHGLPILGGVEWLGQHADAAYVVAVGSSAGRRRIVQRIVAACPNRPATLIHPRAWLGDNVEVGAGSVLCAGCLVTTDIRIGKHVHVNIGATIGHDASLGDYVTLNPGVNVSGNVTLNEGVEVGTGSVIIPRIAIGHWSVLGAGAVVTRSLDANVTAVGAPARPIKTREAGWHEGPGA
jgi:sugar O-acyltransferase (sialic acid O-acetyltransferase NeuD family)